MGLLRSNFYKTNSLYSIIIFAVLVLQFITFYDMPFFWDAVSKSSRAFWILDNNFKSLIVPNGYTSGHPPLWIFLLAVTWKIFGVNLWSARLLMLLVNLALLIQIKKLVFNVFKKEEIPFFLLILVLIEPTLVAQSTVMNNDILLTFFVFLGLNTIIKQKYIFYFLALLGLLMSNLRGVFFAISFFLIHVFYNIKFYGKKWDRRYLGYSIPLLCFILFLLYQYAELGWVITSSENNYSSHRRIVTPKTFFVNLIILLRGFIENGKFFVFIPLFFFLIKEAFGEKYKGFSIEFRKVVIALIVIFIVSYLGFSIMSNPSGPRYFLVTYILGTIIFVVFVYSNIKKKGLSFVILLTSLILFITGHFWIFPERISQGWDSSLAYINYYSVEKEMIKFLNDNEIQFDEIGTYIPLNSRHISEAKEIPLFLPPFEEVDFSKNQYILFSNIENTMREDQIDELYASWNEVIEFRKNGVFMKLFKK